MSFFETVYFNGVTTVGDILNEWNFTVKKRFYRKFSHIPPMQYNNIISAISKYMSSLSIDMPSLNRYCSPFMPYYLEYILLQEKITKYIYIFTHV